MSAPMPRHWSVGQVAQYSSRCWCGQLDLSTYLCIVAQCACRMRGCGLSIRAEWEELVHSRSGPPLDYCPTLPRQYDQSTAALTCSQLLCRADRSGLCMSLVGSQLIACGGLDTRALPRDGAEAATANVPWTELDEMRHPRADFGAASIHMYNPL